MVHTTCICNHIISYHSHCCMVMASNSLSFSSESYKFMDPKLCSMNKDSIAFSTRVLDSREWVGSRTKVCGHISYYHFQMTTIEGLASRL